MPAKSRKQQRYLYANFGEAWVKAHHFDKVASQREHSARANNTERKKRHRHGTK